MYIKEVVILNFKSYGGKTVINNINPRSTLLVGSNGAGKSNFFQAIKFIVDCGSSSYSRQVEKLKIYHNGRRTLVSVEIILANCELSSNGGDLSLKRAVNGEINKFYINNKQVTLKYFQTILEICGFSSIKPYYFASHHIVNDIVTSTPNARLKYFLTCLGSNVSLTLGTLKKVAISMETMKYRFEKANDFIIQLDTKDNSLMFQEVVKLKKFKELKKIKSFLLMLIHQKFILRWQHKINELKSSLTDTETGSNLTIILLTTNTDLSKLKQLLNEVKITLINSTTIKNDILKEEEELLEKEEKIVLNLAEVENNIRYLKDKIEAEYVDKFDEEIQILIHRLSDLDNKYLMEKEKLAKLEQLISIKDQSRDDLISKLTRNTKEERDLWINNQLSVIQDQLEVNTFNYLQLQKKHTELINESHNLEVEIMKMNDDSPSNRSSGNEEAEVKLEYTTLLTNINDLRQIQCESEGNVKILRENLNRKIVELRLKQGRATYDGCQSVDKVLEKWRQSNDSHFHSLLRGYFGLVIDNLSCNEQFNIAIETAVGKKLFQHIVEDNNIGNAILEEMKAMHLPGEVWFIPLSRIKVPQYQYPNIDVVRPLIYQLEYQSRVTKAMEFIFGKILICKDLNIAVKIARLYHFTCVTLSGDKIHNNGVISGGFINQLTSIRTVYINYIESKRNLEQSYKKLDECRRKLKDKELRSDHLLSVIHQLKTSNIAPKYSNISSLTKRQDNVEAEIDLLGKKLTKLRTENQRLHIREASLKDGLNQIFIISSESDEVELGEINRIIMENMKIRNQLSTYLMKMESEKVNLENDLRVKQNIRKLNRTSFKELRVLEQRRKDLQAKQKLLENRIQRIKEKLILIEEKIGKAKEKEVQLVDGIDNLKRTKIKYYTDTSIIRRQTVYERIRSLEMKIDESKVHILGTNNSKQFQNLNLSLYDNYTPLMLIDEAKLIKNKIKNLGLISLKAEKIYKECIKFQRHCQYVETLFNNFTKSYVILMDFIDWLELHIEAMFDQVSSKFNYFFKTFIPNGHATLELTTDIEENISNGNDDDDVTDTDPSLNSQEGLMRFGRSSGITISVRFTGQLEVREPSALSSGQQTIILLSIVLAFLTTQNFSICFMDEVDRHLGHEHVERLIELLNRLDGIQFFITSHNIDVLKYATDIYHVYYHCLKSNLTQIGLSEAQRVLENLIIFSDNSPSLSNGSL